MKAYKVSGVAQVTISYEIQANDDKEAMAKSQERCSNLTTNAEKLQEKLQEYFADNTVAINDYDMEMEIIIDEEEEEIVFKKNKKENTTHVLKTENK